MTVRYSAEWLAELGRATVTTAEAARVLGTTPKTVIALIRSGALDGFKLGGRYHVHRVSLLGLITPP